MIQTDDMNDIVLRGLAAEDAVAIETKAREHYEASRKRVSGRPAWESLNPADPYDMGMREYAIAEAKKALGFEPR